MSYPEGPTPTPEKQPRKPRHPNWGGRRKGAGAPKGNLNNYRDGRYSSYQRRITEIMADIPELHAAMIKIARRTRRRKQQAEVGASELMAEVFRRIGESLVSPSFNHLESNQDLIDAIHAVHEKFLEISAGQSSASDGQSSG